jgi:CRP-like cAMP-binding protein
LLGRAAGRRAATVRAIGPVKVARIGTDDFHRALPEHHRFFKQLVNLGEAQLRERLAQQSLLFRALLSSEGDDKGEAFELGAEIVTFERGQALFYQGEPSDAVFVVASGAAGVYTDNEGQPQLVARIEAGQCVGERGLLRREPHTTTAIAEERLTAFRIPGNRFLDLHARSPELRDYLQSLERIHELPRRGFVTQFAGQFLGRECITSVYHLPRGRRAVASHVPGETLHHLEVHAPGENVARESIEEHRFENLDLGIERKIVVSRSGKLVSLTARGEWDELPELFVLALGRRIAHALAARRVRRDGIHHVRGAADVLRRRGDRVHVHAGSPPDDPGGDPRGLQYGRGGARPLPGGERVRGVHAEDPRNARQERVDAGPGHRGHRRGARDPGVPLCADEGEHLARPARAARRAPGAD